MKYTTAFLAILLLTHFSCNKKNKTYNLEASQSKEIFLSEVASNIEYIPLSSDIKMKKIRSMRVDSSYFWIGTGKALLQFDRKGNFLEQIGKRGKGRGEYILGSKFTISEKQQRVYILNSFSILVYSYKGNFIKKIDLRHLEERMNTIEIDNNRIILTQLCANGYPNINGVS